MSRTLIDLAGKQIGRLVVIRRVPNVGRRAEVPAWLCRCACGTEIIVRGYNLRSGTSTSCGCRARELSSIRSTKHKAKGTPEHNSWRGMRERCLNPNSNHWASYGGRGISFDPEWNDFLVFLRDMGPRPPGSSLERIDNNKPYCKANCTWATPAEQQRNTTRAKRITYNSITKNLCDWASALGITPGALRHRIRKFGLSRAMTMKKGQK
jgi:hypothetical protein